jgi:phage protein U
MFALLGPIFFEVVGSPSAISRKNGYDYPEQKVVEDAPRLQWIGRKLEEMTLECKFHISFVNPATQITLIRASATAHQALPLVFGNGDYRGLFVITEIEETSEVLADDGSPIAVSMRLSLKEWVAVAAIDPDAPPIPATPPLAIAAAANGTPGATPNDLVFTTPAAGTSALISNPLDTGATGPDLMYTDVDPQTIVRMDTSP